MVTIQKAELEDTEAILSLQKLAYESEARLYNDWSLPALTQSIESLQEEFASTIVLKGLFNDVIVGSVRAKAVGNICEIGRLTVHPKYQRQGIGSELLRAIEKEFNSVKKYKLFTGSSSIANIKLYERHGYAVTHTEPLSKTVSITYLEKPAW